MIDRRDQHSPNACADRVDAETDGHAHFAVRIRVRYESDRRIGERVTHFFGSMPGDDHDLINGRQAKIPDAAFDYGCVAKRKQGFERAHPARSPGGENNCSDIIHIFVELLFLLGWFSKFAAIAFGSKPVTLFMSVN